MRGGASSNSTEAVEKKLGPWIIKFTEFSTGAKNSQCSKWWTPPKNFSCLQNIFFQKLTLILFFQRGTQTFETSARNTLDLCCAPMIKQEPYSLILKYPNHKTGHGNLATDMTLGFIACGVDPLMIELLPDSFNTYSDNPSLSK